MSTKVKVSVGNRLLASQIKAKKLGIDYEGVRRVAHIHLTYGISWDVVAQLMIKYIKENDLHCTF